MAILHNQTRNSDTPAKNASRQGVQHEDSAITPSYPQALPQDTPQKSVISPQQLSPNQQRKQAAKRRAAKKLQRKKAASIPPKPKPKTLERYLLDRGALKDAGNGYGLVSFSKLSAEERAIVNLSIIDFYLQQNGGLR